uniref:Uncharacterized protein n=1 Tax=Rhizophora mucronata TaxID=61149 RepID=A0A2P2QL84_RHIMU
MLYLSSGLFLVANSTHFHPFQFIGNDCLCFRYMFCRLQYLSSFAANCTCFLNPFRYMVILYL